MAGTIGPYVEKYLAGIADAKQRGRILNALGREMTINGSHRMSRADHALRLYGMGYRVRTHKKDKFRLVAPNGTFFDEKDVTKALCDFVVYLTETLLPKSEERVSPKHPADGLGEIFTMDEFDQSIRQ